MGDDGCAPGGPPGADGAVGPRPELAAEVNDHHANERYLPGYELHPELRATSDLAEAVEQADVIVMGVPSQGFRSTLEEVADHMPRVGAGAVADEGPRAGHAAADERRSSTRCCRAIPSAVLTGPNLAKEILVGDAAASVIATPDPVVADHLQQIFHRTLFRVYTNPDVIGCEVGGALKNVIAIAAGMADGLGTGDNTKAAVITRGLAELSRLGEAMGGQFVTFSGLAGMGDLLATCMSPQSRNRYVGEQLGRGRTIDEIIADMNMVAEGVKTCRVVMELAEEYGVEMPIASGGLRRLPRGRHRRGRVPRPHPPPARRRRAPLAQLPGGLNSGAARRLTAVSVGVVADAS